MILEQYYLGCLSQASYLIGDTTTKTAAVVDPRRDVDLYLDEAAARGLTIRHVLLTHFHADFVSGHLELRARTGADIRLGRTAVPEFPFVAVGDGDVLEFGAVSLRFLETPGHTPESICILVHDAEADPENPRAVLTGDTLFVGDVGRPDLMASVGITAEELAGQLYDSTRNKLLTLPDETLVYPGHGAGSMCGKNLSTDTVSTIGAQKAMNAALAPMSRDAFIRLVTQDQPPAPAYFAHDAMLNRMERATLDEILAGALKPLSAEEALALADGGAVLLDVRNPLDYAEAFVPGSVNIGLDGSYAVWAGTILDRSAPIVVVGDPGSEEEAILRLGRIGFDHVAGFVEGGIAAFPADRVSREDRVDAADLAGILDGVTLLDIRNPGEREAKSIKGSVFVPLNRLTQELDAVPRDKDIVVYCASGYRSSIAASLLRKHGFTGVADLDGGILSWEAARLEMVEGLPAS
jgi:glyoxylase-like metal-dependent hydrolase (beta-lactamase superfamily II)/rhodanese-related sulfurtransferase